jgi:hypothetical protein
MRNLMCYHIYYCDAGVHDDSAMTSAERIKAQAARINHQDSQNAEAKPTEASSSVVGHEMTSQEDDLLFFFQVCRNLFSRINVPLFIPLTQLHDHNNDGHLDGHELRMLF